MDYVSKISPGVDVTDWVIVVPIVVNVVIGARKYIDYRNQEFLIDWSFRDGKNISNC